MVARRWAPLACLVMLRFANSLWWWLCHNRLHVKVIINVSVLSVFLSLTSVIGHLLDQGDIACCTLAVGSFNNYHGPFALHSTVRFGAKVGGELVLSFLFHDDGVSFLSM